MTVQHPEQRESLWSIGRGPAIWAAHFLFSYLTAAIHCAKAFDVAASTGVVRALIAGYTLFAVSLLALLARRGYRRWRVLRTQRDGAATRHAFLGGLELLLCLLGLAAVCMSALPLLVFETCE